MKCAEVVVLEINMVNGAKSLISVMSYARTGINLQNIQVKMG